MTYRYRGTNRWAPFLPLYLLRANRKSKTRVLFRVDTGADSTIVPRSVIEKMGFKPFDEIIVADYDSRQQMYETFLVQLSLGRLAFPNIEVIASESDTAYLGLDVLNQLKLTLDGRKRRLTVE